MKVYNPDNDERVDPPQHPAWRDSACAPRQPTTIDGVTYKIANTQLERDAALRLVYHAYSATGLMQSSSTGMRFDLRHLLPNSPVFIAQSGRDIVCTMSLFPDSGMGLLLERHFAREVGDVRRSGMGLAEVSCLASQREYFSKGKMYRVFVNLVGLMFHHARFSGIQKLLIAVHPRHVRFYQRLLGFDIVGDRRPYGRVNCQPAVACQHDFTRAHRKSYPLANHIDNLPFATWELLHRPMTSSERTYFMTQSMVLDKMKAA